jgi:hypothetical protein
MPATVVEMTNSSQLQANVKHWHRWVWNDYIKKRKHNYLCHGC